MIINGNLSNNLYLVMDESKTISKLGFSPDELRNWFHTLNTMASMSYKKKMLGDEEISEFNVPGTMEDLVIPRKISYELGEDFEDFRGDSYSEYPNNLKKYGMEDAKILDALKFNVLTKAIMGSRRANNAKVTYVDTLNGEVTVSTVENRINVLNKKDAKVLPKSSYYVPVDFKYNYQVENFYTQDPESMVAKWFFVALNNLSNN